MTVKQAYCDWCGTYTVTGTVDCERLQLCIHCAAELLGCEEEEAVKELEKEWQTKLGVKWIGIET